MGERVRGRRVGEVVGGHVDRLHGRDRAGPRRRDPLLELAHLGGERRLVADGARHPAEQRRHLGARLDEPEDVVDEEEDVLTLVAKVLRHRQPGEAHAQARTRRLVHLPVDERDAIDHAGLRHLEPEVVALSGALADAGEDRHAAVLLGDVVDQLLDQHRLAEPGAAEEADLAAAHERGDQVDDLDPGLEDLRLRREVAEQRRVAVDRPPLARRGAASGRPARRARSRCGPAFPSRPGRDRRAGVDDVDAARQAVGGVHCDRADAVVAQVLLHLGDQVERRRAVAAGDGDPERVVDLGQAIRGRPRR